MIWLIHNFISFFKDPGRILLSIITQCSIVSFSELAFNVVWLFSINKTMIGGCTYTNKFLSYFKTNIFNLKEVLNRGTFQLVKYGIIKLDWIRNEMLLKDVYYLGIKFLFRGQIFLYKTLWDRCNHAYAIIHNSVLSTYSPLLFTQCFVS